MRIVGLIATVFGFALVGSPAQAALPEWEHVTAFNVAETSGATLNTYPTELVVDTQALIAAGQLEADLSDLRFAYDCAGDELIPHWVQPGTAGTTETRVWVALDLPASQTTVVRMFHGNPAAMSNEVALDAMFDGPVSATDQVTGGTSSNVANSIRGFSFTPQRDVLVTEMGKNEPNGTTRTLTLWDEATQTILRTITVGGAASAYSYEPLPEPVWLDSGSNYIATIFQGANDGYFYLSSSQISADLTYNSMRFCNSCTPSTFPTSILSNYHYGFVDFRYYTRPTAASEPTVAPTALCPEDATCDGDCSVALCGDEFVNASANEECDDGNLIDGDGCSSTCLVESGPSTSTGGDETTTDPGTGSPTSGPDPSTTTSPPATDGGDDTADDSAGQTTDSNDEGTSAASNAGSEGGDVPFTPGQGLGETGCFVGTRRPSSPASWMLLLVAGSLLRRRRAL